MPLTNEYERIVDRIKPRFYHLVHGAPVEVIHGERVLVVSKNVFEKLKALVPRELIAQPIKLRGTGIPNFSAPHVNPYPICCLDEEVQ